MFDIMGLDQAPGLVIPAPGPEAVPGRGRVPAEALPTATVQATPLRPDAGGEMHPVEEASCACGCPYLYAADDLALFWEPGADIGPDCADRSCECHASPLRG